MQGNCRMQTDKHSTSQPGEAQPHHWLRHSFFPVLLIVALGTIFSLILAKREASQLQIELENRFSATVQQTSRVLQQKVDRFSLLMKAGRGLVLNHTDTPTVELNRLWHNMFDSYGVNYSELGVVGLSYTRYLAPYERSGFIQRFNQSSDRKLTIFPPPSNETPSFVIMHLIPAEVENRMLGYDIYSGESRRKAAIEAMTSGQMSVTLPLSLLPTDINSLDYLLLLPVKTDTTFLGWITLGFSMSQLVQESLNNLNNPLRIQVHDHRLGSQTLSHDTHPQLDQPDSNQQYEASLIVAGQTLRLQISALDPNLHQSTAGPLHYPTLIAGISLTLLIASLLMFFSQARNQAQQASHRMAARADEMHQLYRTLFAQSPEAIVVHINGNVKLANHNAAVLFGCDSAEELLHHGINTLVHPDSLDLVHNRSSALARGESLKPSEQKLIRLDGSIFDAEVSSTMIHYQGKQAIQVMFRDITSDKRHRQESRIAQTVFRHSHEAIMVTDERGRIELANDAFQALTGYSPQSVTGRSASILNSGHHDNSFFYDMWKTLADTNQWRGDIVNRTREGHIYIQETSVTAVKDEQQQTRHYVCLMRDVTEKRRSFDHIRFQALHDPLTQLPNRVHFEAHAEKSLRDAHQHNANLHLFLLDLDNFKQINETHGHLVGDQVLVIIAQRLSEALRLKDIVARFGGDKFAILTENTGHTDEIKLLSERIHQTLSLSITVQDLSFQLTASMGTAVYPDDGDNLYELIACADRRMYTLKERQRETAAAES